ncbi:MAG TPA: M4 family metallopeptidase [Bacteroidales bacterium]|nr:M4 family metallopeptidase [Bacteroidales bacterium]
MKTKIKKNISTKLAMINRFIIILFLFLFCGHESFSQVYNTHKAEQKITGASRIDYAANGDLPEYIKLKAGNEISFGEWEQWLSKSLNLSPEMGFVLKSTERDNLGEVHYRYGQTFQGIEIFEKDIIVHTKDSKVFSFNGKIISSVNVSNSKTMTESQALASAVSYVNAIEYKWEIPGEEIFLKKFTGDPGATYFPSGKLIFLADNNSSSYKLAYRFDIYAHKPMSRSYIFVDAQNGEIFLELSRIHTINDPGTAVTKYSGIQPIHAEKMTDTSTGVPLTYYRLRETLRGNGIETYNMKMTGNYGTAVDFIDTNNYWDNVNAEQDEVATDAHWATERSYDYFFGKFGRNSIDGSGFKLINYVHANLPLIHSSQTDNLNAFWNGACMTYGDGDAANGPYTAVDIVGHEITHGLTEKTANLTYQDESGALNEGFSDIFGTSIEFYAKPASANWTIGEDMAAPFRSMSSPETYGLPDTYHGTNWYYLAGDYGGVHFNCGVLAYWFYLLSQGGAGTNDLGNDYNVTGIGIDDAASIAYRTLTVYLPPASNYKDARKYSLISATDLFGNCSDNAKRVINAWYAVGVGDDYDSTVVKHKDVTCAGDSNGSAWVEIIRGDTANFSYLWNTSDTLDSIHGLAEGQYNVIITNSVNCIDLINVDIELSMNTLPTTITKTDESCDNSSDGSATVTPGDGTMPFTYSWSNSETDSTLTNLDAGEYNVTVTDSNGCNGTNTVAIVTNNIAFPVSIISSSPPSCHGQSNGKATVSASGGSEPYTYGWSNGSSGSTAFGLSSGSYSVTVTDSSGCHGTTSITINSPPELSNSVAGGNASVYYCGDDPAPPETDLYAMASGGTPPYSYSWQGGSLSVSGSGSYCCSVTDANGCGASSCVSVLFIPVECSQDPNAIAGPAGYAEEQWVSVNDQLSYTVYYENDPDFATAPAQEVKITVPLNDKIDMNSLQIGNFGFGDFIFSVPPGTPYYSMRLDVTESLNVYVDIIAGLDMVNQEAFWIFQSVDPATGLPPNDPQTGFLPVNDTSIHSGEGYVTFSVKPKAVDNTGDSVLVKAEIIFDVNEPINTNQWFNVIDALPPSTTVDTLVLTSPGTADLSFTGQDDVGGCGIQKYLLYYSKDGGPYYLYGEYNLGNVAHIIGIENSEYRFFSIARDHVGNTEPMKNITEGTIFLGNPRAISGAVTYQNILNTPISNALVYLRDIEGAQKDSVFTGINGTYDFGNKPQNTYLINAYADFPWGGVNSTDALLVRRAVIGLTDLNRLQDSAADVNHSNTISSTDALLIRRRVVGQIDNFQINDIVFLKDTLYVTDSNIIHDIKTLCAGDVNGSYQPVFIKSSGVSLIKKGEISSGRSRNIDLPVLCENAISPAAVTLLINYPEHIVEVEAITSVLPGFLFRAEKGKIIVAWDSISPAIFDNNEALCVLHLKVSEIASENDTITLMLDAQSEFAEITAEIMDNVYLSYPEIRISTEHDFELSQNYPNPYNGETEIGYVLAEDGNVILKAYNVLGQEVKTLVSGRQKAGKYHLRFDSSKFSSGTYYYKIVVEGLTRDFTATHSMIILPDN